MSLSSRDGSCTFPVESNFKNLVPVADIGQDHSQRMAYYFSIGSYLLALIKSYLFPLGFDDLGFLGLVSGVDCILGLFFFFSLF